MKIKDTAEGWEIVPETSDEQKRLQWLVEAIKSHPDQQRAEFDSVKPE